MLRGGDVKMPAMMGAFLEVKALPWVIFISAALGSLGGLAWAVSRGQWRTTPCPTAPSWPRGR
jgi:prepilin signal peptidase PulO-like enzyme (type II secretory pathway)